MDAFDKLAKLAGASVESVGEGLPRTRAEALALGVTRYFTGKPCKRGHVADRRSDSGDCAECGCQRNAMFRNSPDGKEWARQHRNTYKRKEWARQYKTTLECRERDRQRELKIVGDAVLFAIGQAEYASRMARVCAEIVPQCPEPQRSQLQALVDRIKADPQAGKAVVGLLRTMRELRKAELAEMNPETET